MGSKKRTSIPMEEAEVERETPFDSNASKPSEEPQIVSTKPMERRKKRKALVRERHHADSQSKPKAEKPPAECAPSVNESPLPSSRGSEPGLHVNVFRELASADANTREAAAESLALELIEVHRVFEEESGDKMGLEEEGAAQLEAEKKDGLENCTPSLRYAIRRLIRGVSSSRELTLEAVVNHVLEVPGLRECYEEAISIGDPDALFLALKLHERISVDSEVFGKLLPCPFSPDSFFIRDHLVHLTPCFKESTFCHPRVHSVWRVLTNILLPDSASLDEVAPSAHPSKKHKKSRKSSSFEGVPKNLRCFCEVVIESLLLSSHERKHLALMIILLLLPRLPASYVPIVLSYKLVQCLMDMLPNKGSHLHETSKYFMKELVNSVGNDDRCVNVIVALQKHSGGRFDCITKTKSVRELAAKFNTSQDCLLFVHKLMSLFVDDGDLRDVPSDQSRTTYENSEGSVEDKEILGGSGNMDVLRSWIINTMPLVLKNLKLNSSAKLTETEIVESLDENFRVQAETQKAEFLDEKFRVQAEIMKFLAVQGLFSASLASEVTSFELQEKFRWPRVAILSSLCKLCIEQLQLLLEDARRGEVSNISSTNLQKNDLVSYFMCFLKTLCTIPSVSLFRKLSEKDEMTIKKLQSMESRLFQEENNVRLGLEASKLHALRYVLIQLVFQVLLCPEEYVDAASELAICCKKAAAAAAAQGDSSEDENELDDNEMPDMMDVLMETFLSLLPHLSGPLCFSIKHVGIIGM